MTSGCRNHELFPELLPRLNTLAMPDQVSVTVGIRNQDNDNDNDIDIVSGAGLAYNYNDDDNDNDNDNDIVSGAGLTGPALPLSLRLARRQGALAQALHQQPPAERAAPPVSR